MKLPVGIRLLRDRYFGEASRNPWVARNQFAKLSEQLPPTVVPIVSAAVDVLMNYQNPDYVLLYLDRIGRYAGANALPPDILVEVARLMADRMAYEDPIRCAQLALERAGGATAKVDRSAPVMIHLFTWGEVVSMLPTKAAKPALDQLQRLADLALVQHAAAEEVLGRAAIDNKLPVAGIEAHARNRGFAAAGALEIALLFAHVP